MGGCNTSIQSKKVKGKEGAIEYIYNGYQRGRLDKFLKMIGMCDCNFKGHPGCEYVVYRFDILIKYWSPKIIALLDININQSLIGIKLFLKILIQLNWTKCRP